MDWLVSLGSVLSPVGSAASAGQALGNQFGAGSNQRDGLVADAASSLATGAVTLGAIGASKVLSSAAEQAATLFDEAAEFADRAIGLSPELGESALGMMDDALAASERAESLSAQASSYATPIIDAALITHALLSLANGFGTPNSGTQLGSAAGELDWAVDRLATAGKTDGWTSADAEPRYRNANTVQQKRVGKIAEIDRKFEKALKAQATQVYDLKEIFGYIKTAMNSAKILAMALNMAGPPGQAASVVLQTTTATACLLADASHQGMQHQKAQQNAIEFESLASAYQGCQQP
ncbi:MAG: EspA/EspE family type VII secretion system effector [Mycobacterium sp.]